MTFFNQKFYEFIWIKLQLFYHNITLNVFIFYFYGGPSALSGKNLDQMCKYVIN